MYLTQKNQLRNLGKVEFLALKELCRLSKNLYNVGLYNVRQYFFEERKHLRYESAYHLCKENENYQALNTDIAQQTLKVVDRTFNGFFGLIKAVRSGTYQQKVKLPHYLPKDGYFVLIIPRIKVKDGKFKVPMSPAFKKQFGEVVINFPERLNSDTIKEVRIHPKYDARFFEVEYISRSDNEPVETIPDSSLAIDFGLDNLATCVDTNGASFIVDGRKLKSINQWFNKENARLQSIKDRQKIQRLTERQARLYVNRSNKVRDYLNKAARLIIDHCINAKIECLIVGFNLGMKQDINLGSRTNQNFVQIPFFSLRNKLKSLCERYGLQYKEQEESYTSKSSYLDGDNLPIYNADKPATYQFSGKRVKRGLYRSKEGHLINADANGAANIGKKSKQNGFTGLSRGCLAQPLRIKVY
ncbi:IS200/IS605 family element transposase accessory protein TnpB [Hassallia byssoidea VB512170]|uniref:IS200/IS605 family element transposase accessory protein TnpB n=1 Tax=Hassallia byssoidea VB512170 TaxID=1304833 RepID=A0A846H7Z5_9CYAN|nr:RNA-guided endonuclease TnpB family protein [Hassalia byssoidea]NEU73737.1 IS200/IS605 family element transposase accessory protein TnpB [Hassalia byssoidea VB512170]